MQQKEEKEGETSVLRRQIQKRFTDSILSSSLFPLRRLPLSPASLLFTGLILVVVTTISAPIAVVYAANIQGTSGDDTLNGTPRADVINGLDGNDKMYGRAGNDALDGGDGDDEIHGGNGNDKIKDANDEVINYGNKVYGGSGNDNIEAGIDYTLVDFYYVYGEAGSDYIKVISNAFIRGGIGHDTIYCTGYECDINGDGGNDVIRVELYDVGSHADGGSGDDKLFGKGYSFGGGPGNDYLSSAPYLSGGEGDDVLEEGELYNGGPGADTFKCSSGPYDTIEDYNPEEGDQIVNIEDCETVEHT